MADLKQSTTLPAPLVPKKVFIQPLAMALVCSIFIGLSIIMGAMNLKMLDQALGRFVKYKAGIVVSQIHQSIDWYLQNLVQADSTVYLSGHSNTYSDERLSLQEAFIIDLMPLAQRFAGMDTSDRKALEDLAYSQGIDKVAVIDRHNQVRLCVGNIPQTILDSARPVVDGQEDFIIHIFDRMQDKNGVGFLVMPRASQKGALILALDRKGFKFQSLKFAVSRTLKRMTMDKDVAYVLVRDPKLRIFGFAGPLAKHRIDAFNAIGIPKASSRQAVKISGHDIIEVTLPFAVNERIVGSFCLGMQADLSVQVMSKNKWTTWLSVIFMGMMTILAMWLLYRNQNRHVFQTRELERRMQQAERLSALGGLAAGVAHEIRNPLNAISIGIQRVQRDTNHKLAPVIRDEIRRLNQIIEEFISIAKTRQIAFKPFDLRMALDQIVMLMKEDARARQIDIHTKWSENDYMIDGDADKIKQALINVVKNAIEAVQRSGRVEIRLENVHLKLIRIVISDTGTGIKPEDVERIFDPDFTTKEKGLGLGLSLAYEIIKAHGGRIAVDSQYGKGTTFEISLPVLQKDAHMLKS